MTAAEVLDVARHVPLEVDHARAGAAAAASATAASATSAATAGGRRHHDDRDGHVDGRPVIGLAAAVVGLDRDAVGVLRGDNEGRSRGDGDLATAAVDLERRCVGAGEVVGEGVALDVRGGDGRADVVAGLGVLGDGARGRRWEECRGVVHRDDGDADRAVVGELAVGQPVGEAVLAGEVRVRRVGDGPVALDACASVERLRPHRDPQAGSLRIGIRVVVEHVDVDPGVLGGHRRVVDGGRGLGNVGDVDGDVDAVSTALAVVGGHGGVVGRRALPVERDAGGHPDLPGGGARGVDHEVRGPRESVGERAVVNVGRRYLRAHRVARPGALGNGARGHVGRELGRVVHRGDLDGYAGGAREATAVRDLVGEAVGAVVVGVGLVGDRAVVAQVCGFIHRRASVARRGDHRQQQFAPLVLGVAVVVEDADLDRGVLVESAGGVGDGIGWLVHVRDVDGDLDGVEGERGVGGGDHHAVRGRRFVIERLVSGDPDLAAAAVNREQVRAPRQRVGQLPRVLGVGGHHRRPDGVIGPCVLGHGTRRGPRGELRGGVHERLGLDTVCRDRGEALVRAVTVRIRGGGVQVVIDVAYDGRVAGSRGAVNRLPAAPRAHRPLPTSRSSPPRCRGRSVSP